MSSSTSKKPIYKKIYFKVIAFVLIIYCLIWLLSSPLITHFAKEPLAEMGLILSPKSTVRFNPFLTRVTVTEFSWLKDDKNVLNIQSVALQVALHKILFDKVEIEELSINGITVEVEKEADKLFVAGIDLSSTKSTEEEAPEESEAPLPYQVLLKSLAITNINVNALIDKNPHTYKITELYINDIEATQVQQSANIKLLSLINNAALNMNAVLAFNNGEGVVKSDILIDKFPLTTIHHLAEPLKQLSGAVTFSSKQTVTLESNEIKIAIPKAELLNEKLLVNTEDNIIKLDALALNLNDLSLSLINSVLENIEGVAQFSVNNANVFGEKDTQVIASFTDLTIKNIVPSLQNAKNNDNNSETTLAIPNVSIDALTINDLLFSQNTTNDLPAVATVKQIIVDSIMGNENSVAVNTITLDSLTSHVILNKEKALANLVAFGPESEKASELNEPTEPESTEENVSPETEKKPETNPFLISLNEFNLINTNDIFFEDNSVNPIYERSIMIDKLAVGALSNHPNKKENKTSISLVGRSNQYANFDFGGFIQPFAQIPTYYVKGDLNELSLLSASTYMKDALDLGLTSGQLNTGVDLTLAGEDIKGDIVLNIKGLETGAAIPDNIETDKTKGQVSFSLNTALAMLKDDTGNIELDIPLSGKTSDPSFGTNSIISIITKKAIVTATETYLVRTLVPGGNLVSVAMLAGDIIMKKRFEDLPYAPAQEKLNNTQTEYVQNFIALMKDKKDIQVKLCAISTPSDIGLTATSKLSLDDINKLKALGIERENNYKSHVVKQGIESGRILLCAPTIDTDEGATPRMSISV